MVQILFWNFKCKMILINAPIATRFVTVKLDLVFIHQSICLILCDILVKYIGYEIRQKFLPESSTCLDNAVIAYRSGRSLSNNCHLKISI